MRATEPGKDPNGRIFYRPDAPGGVEPPEEPREGGLSKHAKRGLFERRGPIFLPGLIILIFIIVLSSVGVAVQHRRLRAVQRDFEALVLQCCTELVDPRSDLDGLARTLDSVAAKADRISSGPFALLLPSARGLERKARELSAALNALRTTSPGDARQEGLLNVVAALDRSGVVTGSKRHAERRIQQNLAAWGQALRADASTLPQDGRSPEWKEWSEKLKEYEQYDRDDAASIRHDKLSDHLDLLEIRWQRGSRFADYGDSFESSFAIYDLLERHRCSVATGRPTCRDRWNSLCRSLFENWAEDVRDRSSRGEDINEISHQFDGCKEQASRFGEFRSAKLSVDGCVVASQSR